MRAAGLSLRPATALMAVAALVATLERSSIKLFLYFFIY
jgi:hypothetical protein